MCIQHVSFTTGKGSDMVCVLDGCSPLVISNHIIYQFYIKLILVVKIMIDKTFLDILTIVRYSPIIYNCKDAK